jgi:predicted RNA methylase
MTGATGNIYAGLHDFHEMALLLHFLRPCDVFVDIGANVGAYSVLASGVVGAKTFAFEPVPQTFACLRDNVRMNDLQD